MASEPSKYDPLACYLVGALHADAAFVLVVGGDLGSGCARAELPKADPNELAELRARQVRALRMLADDIEGSVTQADQAQGET